MYFNETSVHLFILIVSNVSLATLTEDMLYKTPFLSANDSVFELFSEARDIKNRTTPTKLLGIKLTEEDVPLLREVFSNNKSLPTFTEFLEFILSTELLGNSNKFMKLFKWK